MACEVTAFHVCTGLTEWLQPAPGHGPAWPAAPDCCPFLPRPHRLTAGPNEDGQEALRHKVRGMALRFGTRHCRPCGAAWNHLVLRRGAHSPASPQPLSHHLATGGPAAGERGRSGACAGLHQA